MMRTVLATLAILAAGTLTAAAEDVIVKDRPGVVVTPDRPAVERSTTVESDRANCDSKTIHKEGPEGSKTVHKERCD